MASRAQHWFAIGYNTAVESGGIETAPGKSC
jgi:hypothetical protein